jgi:hypothetical protein
MVKVILKKRDFLNLPYLVHRHFIYKLVSVNKKLIYYLFINHQLIRYFTIKLNYKLYLLDSSCFFLSEHVNIIELVRIIRIRIGSQSQNYKKSTKIVELYSYSYSRVHKFGFF